jgi:L-aminopeptidase/D-esterase-like protein
MALGIEGLRVGTWTSPAGPSGCTVVLPPEGSTGAIAVRGQAPGTREAAALGPFGKVDVVHGVVLAGGSAFGLAAADGVMRWLEAEGTGYPLPTGVVPIVGAAIVLDQGATDPAVRPDAAAGWTAAARATDADPDEGAVGAGAGVTVAKVGGVGHAWRSGQGLAVRRDGDLVVGALVVNNAVGEVVDGTGRPVVGTRAPADATRFPADPAALFRGMPGTPAGDVAGGGPTANTVIGCVVTNARLPKLDVHRVADLAHDGIALAVRPAHTTLDGDALFGVAVPRVDATLDQVADLAVQAVADAARRGPLAARTTYGMPGPADLAEGLRD